MPLFLIERNFAEQLELNHDAVTAVKQVNADVGAQWLFSFLSAEVVRESARRLNIPADVIIEVGELRPEQFV